MALNTSIEQRILVLAPRGRDSQVIEQVLARVGFTCRICSGHQQLTDELDAGAGAALVAEEAILDADLGPLVQWLSRQESWSDFPFVLLVSKQAGPRSGAALALLERLSNVILLERPLNAETLRRATASALRARRRQYQARSDLEQLHQSQNALRQLNETLEGRIEDRTAELAQANDRLMKEVTERERTQVALLQAQKMEALGRLTGGIAHDFNNLLNVIVGNVDLIERFTTDERIKRMAGTARNASQRGAKLTAQLLAFSRSESLVLKPVDLAQLTDGVKDLLSASVGSNVAVHYEVSPDMPHAIADFNQIELAILNLAINARDAMPTGGKLTVRCEVRRAQLDLLARGDYAVISVSDTGTGIAPEILSKVFDPFFTTKSVGKGTGLGLSQVYGIARQSGGGARIDSELGRGTTVEIWLPLAGAATQPEAPVSDAREKAPGHGNARILVVEDDAGVRQFIVDCLEILGYRVTQAEDGPSGLERLDKDNPDLVIVDFLMPGMNGAELVAKLVEKRPSLPVIVATGYFDMRALDKVIGANSILRKPFQMADLASSVQRALAGS